MLSTIKRKASWQLPAMIGLAVAAIALPVAMLVHSASAAVTSVRIGTSSRAIDGTNTWRGTNQLIMYTYSSSQTRVPNDMSNRWGIEVAVNASGVITAKNDRLKNGSETSTAIPTGGYVLSGHGWNVTNSGYEWLLANAEVGKTVTVEGGAPGESYNSDGVKLAEPAVTVNGNNVTYNWTVQTNKSVTFRYLQVAVRPSNDTGFNNNTTINGTRSFTASQSLPNGTYTAFVAYYLTSTGQWVNGPSVEYTVGNVAPVDTTAPSVSLTAPTTNTTVTKGDQVSLAATATDNVGVSKVEFLVNGSVVTTDTGAPYGYSWDTSAVATGNYAITARAYDAAGNVATSTAAQVTVAAAAPAIEATATVNSVAGTATLRWTITGSNPSGWTVGRDGTDTGGYGPWSTTVPGDRREHTFNYLRPGDTYKLTVSASDGRTASVNVVVEATEPEPGDTTAPEVTLTSPANGTSVTKGDNVTISASATDAVGVARVEFLVNGSVVNTDTSSPYSYSWSTSSAAAGSYTITAKAYDVAGNTGTSAATTITVVVPAPTISATATVSGSSATINWTTTGSNPTVWTVGRDGLDTDGDGPWSENVPGDRRQHTFNLLRPGDTYTLTVSASDGRTATATVTIPAPQPDTTAPSVTLTSPANGTAVDKGSTVTITANATDNIGVTKVEFLVNGTVVNTDTSAPYSYGWSTASAATGNHTVTAKAYDAAGNVATSTAATVTVNAVTPPADTTAPSVSLTSPAGNSSATIGSNVTIAANASDNVGVTKVEFLVNGSAVNTDTGSPYSYSWSTTGRSAGSYAITAKAYDAANNVTTSSAVTITLTPASTPGTWLSGVATMENGNGADPAKYFGDWRGTPVQIGQTWPHTPDVWGINPVVGNSWSGFQGPMSLSYQPGPDWKGLQGWRSWSAMANGNMDAWWRAAAKQTKEFRQGKGTTYISPFYEYNGDWMQWSVTRTPQGMADFRAAWERVAAIWRQEFPGVRLVLPAACVRDVPQAMMPAQNSYDHIGCTIYNAWPWQANGGEAVRMLEVGRQRALANGKSLVITEWANSGNPYEQGGGGDAPGFIQAFHDYFRQHGGTGPGKLEFETFFNIDGYALDHIMLRRSGNNVIVNPTQPQTAAKYQQLF